MDSILVGIDVMTRGSRYNWCPHVKDGHGKEKRINAARHDFLKKGHKINNPANKFLFFTFTGTRFHPESITRNHRLRIKSNIPPPFCLTVTFYLSPFIPPPPFQRLSLSVHRALHHPLHKFSQPLQERSLPILHILHSFFILELLPPTLA